MKRQWSEEIKYWKKAALKRVSTESKKEELIDLTPLRVSWIWNVKSAKTVNIGEIIF